MLSFEQINIYIQQFMLTASIRFITAHLLEWSHDINTQSDSSAKVATQAATCAADWLLTAEKKHLEIL